MTDIYIFGFGLVVTMIVGFGLLSFIHSNNRAIESEEEEAEAAASEFVPVGRDV